MRHLTTLITILFISLLSSPSLSETVSLDDLVKRNDLYFEKFTDVPFTGEVSGQYNGKFKNGKRKGKWLSYYSNSSIPISSAGISWPPAAPAFMCGKLYNEPEMPPSLLADDRLRPLGCCWSPSVGTGITPRLIELELAGT